MEISKDKKIEYLISKGCLVENVNIHQLKGNTEILVVFRNGEVVTPLKYLTSVYTKYQHVDESFDEIFKNDVNDAPYSC